MFYLIQAQEELMASAENLNIDEVSEIEIRVEDLVETQEDCIQLLREELKQNTSKAAYLKKIKATDVNMDWYSNEQNQSPEIPAHEIEVFIQVGPSEEINCPFEVDWDGVGVL